MASLNYTAMIAAVAKGRIDFESDRFACLLVSAAYVPDKSKHVTREQISGEVRGEGYERGGVPVQTTVTRSNDDISVVFSSPRWERATISARGAVIYRVNGGELISYVDFGEDVQSTRGEFAAVFTQPLVFANRSAGA